MSPHLSTSVVFICWQYGNITNTLAYITLDEQSSSVTQEKHRGKDTKISGAT